MKDAERIIEAYRKGNDEERLHMFPEYRSFQEAFAEMDQEDSGDKGIR